MEKIYMDKPDTLQLPSINRWFSGFASHGVLFVLMEWRINTHQKSTYIIQFTSAEVSTLNSKRSSGISGDNYNHINARASVLKFLSQAGHKSRSWSSKRWNHRPRKVVVNGSKRIESAFVNIGKNVPMSTILWTIPGEELDLPSWKGKLSRAIIFFLSCSSSCCLIHGSIRWLNKFCARRLPGTDFFFSPFAGSWTSLFLQASSLVDFLKGWKKASEKLVSQCTLVQVLSPEVYLLLLFPTFRAYEIFAIEMEYFSLRILWPACVDVTVRIHRRRLAGMLVDCANSDYIRIEK